MIMRNFWRLLKKYYLKVIRANDSPHAIALGFALGLFFGTAIPLGQAVLAILFAFIFRANKIVAFAVTWVSNPYTTPFMYLLFCYTGSRVLGSPLNFQQIKQAIKEIFTNFSWDSIFHVGVYIIVTYIIGGIIIGGALAIIGYFVSLHLIIRYRKRKQRRREAVKS